MHTWDIESDEYETPTFSPFMTDNLIGCTFLTTSTEDGRCFHACIICCIEEIDETTDKVHTKFLIHKSDDELDQIMGYHELLETLEEQHQCELENDTFWQLKQKTGHQGPLNKDDMNYKGCSYNVTVEWEDDSITHGPLNIFGHDAPEICVEHRQKQDLLNEPGWKCFHCIAKLKKKVQQMTDAAKLKRFCKTVQEMCGVCIPHETKEAL